MISKNTEKLLRKLQSKKYRWNYKMFIAEGPKVVAELLSANLKPEHLFSDAEKWVTYGATMVDSSELKNISQLETSNEVIGIFPFPEQATLEDSQMVVVLDGLNDPGNLGTIVRTCDWFGVRKVYCTKGTTDVYNAKCIQSTMGSISRVEVIYLKNDEILESLSGRQLFVADMNGKSPADIVPTAEPIALIMGNESHGPSDFWKENAEALTISKIGSSPIESLNVAQASAILLSHFSQG